MAYMQFWVLPIRLGGGQVQDVDLSPWQPFGLHGMSLVLMLFMHSIFGSP